MWSSIREKNLNDEEMLKEIQKEIQNQEVLLQGYQQVKIMQYCDFLSCLSNVLDSSSDCSSSCLGKTRSGRNWKQNNLFFENSV